MIQKLTTFIGLAAATAGLALAQGPGGTPPDPQTMIQMRVDRLTAQLSLTDTQKAGAAAIFSDAFTAADSIRTDLRANRQSLSDAIKKNDTAAISSLAAAAGVLSGQLTALNCKAEAALYATLTADQQAKYDSQPRGGPGGGPGGPMGLGGFGRSRAGGPPR